ncbi:MAG: peptidase M16 [Candidatus Riflebacteria bacterium HGW-Riflebacteria-2]|jgi:zinc protease|nr:MAG: peptidase M16 [Candidatus Riflebacteria bacterium HGW-Riflebacteria-2]
MIARLNRQFCTVIAIATLFAAIVSVAGAVDLNSLVYPALNQIAIPEVEEIKLENGMRLYLLEDKTLPLIHATVRIHGGSYLDPADKIGLAELCGDLLRTGGTAKYSSDELDELLESIGGSAETSIDIIAGSLKLSMLSSYTELAMEVMAEILQRPVFEQAKFEQLMISARSSVSRRNDRPASIGDREFEKVIYGKDSPYARHPEYATLNAISRDDLKAFHQRVFRPENVQMAIWGDIDSKKIVELVKKHFGAWEKGKETLPDFPKVDYKFDTRTNFVDLPDVSQSNVYIGHLGGRLTDEDHPHRIVMNNILGVGFGSRLFKQVRSKAGLAYSVYGVFTANLSYPGTFYNYVSTKTESTVKAIRMIIEEIKRIQNEEPTAEELKLGRDRYLNTFVFNFDSKGKIIERLVYYDFFGLPKDFLNKQMEMVKTTTAADVTAAAKKYLKPEALRILVVGAANKLDEPLTALKNGETTAIDITIPE